MLLESISRPQRFKKHFVRMKLVVSTPALHPTHEVPVARWSGSAVQVYAPTSTGLLNQRVYFIQKYREIKVTRRVTILCEQRGGFSAMLCAMIDNV
jgi:hypothetical protein